MENSATDFSSFLFFPNPFFFHRKEKKFEISSKWTIVSCSRFSELEGKVVEEGREGERQRKFSLWHEHPSSEGEGRAVERAAYKS